MIFLSPYGKAFLCFLFAEMNRHHYSLYVHNCRLVFLLRRDFIQLDSFRPAEFHWRLEQVRSPQAPVTHARQHHKQPCDKQEGKNATPIGLHL